MEIGERIRQLRVQKGLTQRDLAEPRYTHAHVCTIEAGKRQPSRNALDYIAGKLGVDVEELSTGRPAGLKAQLQLDLREARMELSRGERYEARSRLGGVLRQARRYSLLILQAKAQEGIALCEERDGHPRQAIELYEKAEELLAKEPANLKVSIVCGKARCLHDAGDVRQALYELESLLHRLGQEGLDDPDALIRIHATMILPSLDLGLITKADESAREAERLQVNARDPLAIATMHVNVARVLLQRKQPKAAEEALVRAEKIFMELDLKTELARAKLARGYVFSRKGTLAKARQELTAALGLLEETQSRLDIAYALTELGRVERLAGNTDQALAHLERGASLLKDKADVAELGRIHSELGELFTEQNPKRAERELRLAIRLFQSADAVIEAALVFRLLGDVLRKSSSRKSCDAYREGLLQLEARTA